MERDPSEPPLHAVLADEPADAPPATTEGQWTRFANNTWLLLATLFLVTGFLGLPLIFYSTKMSLVQKLLLSVAVTIWTCLLIYGTYLVLMWTWSRINQYPLY